ncbi:MAG TPA: Rieske (2Fe-2S) protein [Micromonosporaceae bacterium]|nr:Rieske (2Fe-2S) protein [Micromonosporaceae bacterium]
MTDGPTHRLARRHAIAGVAGVSVAAPVLAACGGDEPGTTATDPTNPTSSGGAGNGGGGGNAGNGGSDALTTTADIPVGGGTIFTDEKVVVTQPSEGDFKAFSAVCTHQGCLVGQVADGTIQCPCHGSQFSIEDGSNVVGPSGSEAGSVAPLPEVGLTVAGDAISLA